MRQMHGDIGYYMNDDPAQPGTHFYVDLPLHKDELAGLEAIKLKQDHAV